MVFNLELPYRKIYRASNSSSQTCGLQNQNNTSTQCTDTTRCSSCEQTSGNGRTEKGSGSKGGPGTAQGPPHHPAAEGFLAFLRSCQQPSHS